MDARLTKQPVTNPPLHTMAGLTSAKNNMTTGENKIFIKAACRIKSASKKDQKNTDFDCGEWGKPWAKDVYLSGKFFFHIFYSVLFNLIFLYRGSGQLL